MFDNIYTQFQDAKHIIRFDNALFWAFVLNRRIKKGDITAQNYAFLSNAYNKTELSCFYRRMLYCALKAIRLDKNYAYAYVMAAYSYVNFGKVDIAIKYCNKAIELAGENYYPALFMLAALYAESEDNENILKVFIKYMKIKSDIPEYIIGVFLANIYVRKYTLKKVLKMLFASCKKYKYIPDIVETLGIIYSMFIYRVFGEESVYSVLFNTGMFEQAMHIANLHLIKKRSSKWYLYKAQCYFMMDNQKKSLYYIDKAEELDNDKEDLNYDFWRALNYNLTDEYNLALKCINNSLLKYKTSEAYLVKALILHEIENYKEALAIYTKVISDFGESAFSSKDLWFLSSCYVHLEDYKKAMTYINKSILLETTSTNCSIKASILTFLGRDEEASVWYRKAEECPE